MTFAPSYLLDDPLVGVEVEVELGVVLLDDDPGGLLHRLGADAAHGEAVKKSGVNAKLDRAGSKRAGKGRGRRKQPGLL